MQAACALREGKVVLLGFRASTAHRRRHVSVPLQRDLLVDGK